MREAAHEEVTIAYSLTQSSKRIFLLCKACKGILAEGTWALNGEIDGVDYLIGPNPRPSCCGREQPVPFLFETPDAAQDIMDQVCQAIEEHETHLVYNYYGKHNFIPKYVN